MLTADLEYGLPPDRIATQPASPRDAARLMVVRRLPGDRLEVEHHHVRDLPELGVLRAGDLLVVNRSRVVPAEFEAMREATGGRVRGLWLEDAAPLREGGWGGGWRVMLEARGRLRAGERLVLSGAEGTALELLANEGGGRWRAAVWIAGEAVGGAGGTLDLLNQIGRPPLPPYIARARRALGHTEHHAADVEAYNTVYADPAAAGSVAAPTAGLHFTPDLLARLDALGVIRTAVTLHVGPGTFLPVRAEHLENHPMHAEHIEVPLDTLANLRDARRRGGRIVVVGTTSVRSLESLPLDWHTLAQSYHNATNLFIRPASETTNGFDFRFTHSLLTNFHLPRSTLLALVAALPGVGLDRLLSLYQEAIDRGYRFYSFGDAMLIV